MDNINPDIVHGHFASEQGFYAALGGRQPLVVSVWGSDVLIHPKRSFMMRAVVGHALRASTLVHTLAPVLTEEVRRYGIAPERILTVPIGIEASWLDRATNPAPRDRIVILSTRAFSDVYDIPTLIHAMHRLRERQPRAVLRLAGDGPLRQSLEQLVEQLGLQAHVEFLGHCSRSRLMEVVADADVYASTSLSDGASISLLEAMAVGLIPVVSDIPANRDWITPGVNGWLVLPRAVEEWAAALDLACGRLEKRADIAAANKALVRRRAVWEEQMQTIEEAYQRLAKS